MARQEYHRDRSARYERIIHKRFPHGATSLADTGKLLGLRIGHRHERQVAEWCEEALQSLSAIAAPTNVLPLEAGQRDNSGRADAS